jgi:hypothetical protein
VTAQRVTLLLLIPAAFGVVLSVFDGAPEQQVISLRFGAAHGVSAASLRCEAGDFHSGAEWAIDDAQTQVEHVFHGPEGDYHCDIRLHPQADNFWGKSHDSAGIGAAQRIPLTRGICPQ